MDNKRGKWPPRGQLTGRGGKRDIEGIHGGKANAYGMQERSKEVTRLKWSLGPNRSLVLRSKIISGPVRGTWGGVASGMESLVMRKGSQSPWESGD